MDNKRSSTKIHDVLWISPILSVIASITVVVLFEKHEQATEYGVPSVFTASRFAPESKIAAVLFGHVAVLVFLTGFFNCDSIFLGGSEMAIIMRYISSFASIFLFIALWCTEEEQYIVHTIACSLFLAACLVYQIIYYVSNHDSPFEDQKRNIIKMMSIVLTGVLVVIWIAASIVKRKKFIDTLRGVVSYLLIVALNFQLLTYRMDLSKISVNLVVEGAIPQYI